MSMARLRFIVAVMGGFLMLVDIDELASSRGTASVSTTFIWRATDEACGFLQKNLSGEELIILTVDTRLTD